MTPRRRWQVAVISVASMAVGGWLAPGLAAQDDPLPSCDERGLDWGLGPGFISGPGRRNIGIVADLSACFTGQTQLAPVDSLGLQNGYPASYTLRLGVDAAWPFGSVDLPQTSTISVSAGLSVSLAKPDLIAPDTLDPDSLPDWDGGGFNRGWIEIGTAIEHEASADWGEQNLVGSTQLRYGLSHSGWLRLVPSILLHVDAVLPVTSDVRDAGDIELQGHVRWGARAYWNTGLDFVAARLAAFRLRADLALYRTSGLEEVLAEQGWNEGEYVTVTLSREKFVKLLGPIGIGSFYARYMNGRWPTIASDADAFTAGLTIRAGTR